MAVTELTRPAFNREMKRYAELAAGHTIAQGRAQMVGSSPKATGEGLRSITPLTKMYQGSVERIAVRFRRHLIWAHHGVGRGRKMDSTQARSAAKPFLTAGIDRYHAQIADVAMRYYAEDLTKNHDKILTRAYQGTSIKITRS